MYYSHIYLFVIIKHTDSVFDKKKTKFTRFRRFYQVFARYYFGELNQDMIIQTLHLRYNECMR